MRRQTILLLAATGGVAVGLASGAGFTSERAGQVLFIPVSAMTSVPDSPEDTLEIIACEPVDAGLEVTGRLEVNGGVQHVLVTGAPRSMAGIRVGVADRWTFQSGTSIGDFRVVLPWADPASRFALVVGDAPAVDAPAASQPCPPQGLEGGRG